MDILVILFIIYVVLSKTKKKTNKTVPKKKRVQEQKTQQVFDFEKEEPTKVDFYECCEQKVEDIEEIKQEYVADTYSIEEVDHEEAFEKHHDDISLTDLEKGIIFAEIFSKPVSKR